MSYNQQVASATDYGVVKIGTGIAVTNGVISASGGSFIPDVGYFYSTQTQSNLASPNIVTMDGVGLSQGVTLVAGSRLTVSKTSNYTLSIMLQFTKSTSSGANATGFFWLRKNGIDVADSASDSTSGTVQQGVIASWSYTLPMIAGDYLEMVWYSVATNAILIAIPATVGPPAIPLNPSVRMTLIQS
jgi:hypothetical protein